MKSTWQVVVAAAVLVGFVSHGFLVNSPEPLQPGTYADMAMGEGYHPDVDRVAPLRFENPNAPDDTRRQLARPDSRTRFAVEGRPVLWAEFLKAWGGSHVATVVVGEDARLISIDLRAVKVGDNMAPRRVD